MSSTTNNNVFAGHEGFSQAIEGLVAKKAVFFAGLPGTGKSLFVHQLAHLAHERGRPVHLLQWDVSRQPFEASTAAQAYPKVAGVTHVRIRRAVGLWARRAVEWWVTQHANDDAILIGEVPLIGERLIELVTPADDAAEDFLSSDDCVFVLPVPSNTVRRHIESERVRRFDAPQHARERDDAPPNVMHATWRDLSEMARALGISGATSGRYGSKTYRAAYEHLLRRRHRLVIKVDALLPTDAMSVYDYPPGCVIILPTASEVDEAFVEAEREAAP